MTWKTTDILSTGAALEYSGSLIGASQVALATGIESWDAVCDETGGRGLGNWWYVVIGGASNSGKTKLMLHLVREAAESGMLPGLITMEVPTQGLQRQVYSNVTSFGYYDFLPRTWDDADALKKTDQLTSDLSAYKQAGRGLRSILVAERDSAPTLSSIMAACEDMAEAGCRCLFIDHLQLIKAPADQIVDKATEISEALRHFAHNRKVLVVALSQLNRFASRERTKRPTMHDLWGGTAIESNANQVMVIDHSKQWRDPDRPHLLRTWLFLDKNREGMNRITIPVEVDFRTGVWREAQPDEVHEWPTGKAAK
jgi:replicative DNA helicase